jgi:hypothetical protein
MIGCFCYWTSSEVAIKICAKRELPPVVWNIYQELTKKAVNSKQNQHQNGISVKNTI